MLTPNLLAVVSDLLGELELRARDVAELVVLPDVVAAWHAERDADEQIERIESTSWPNTGRLLAIVQYLCFELGVDPTCVQLISLSARDGVCVELGWPAPIRLEP